MHKTFDKPEALQAVDIEILYTQLTKWHNEYGTTATMDTWGLLASSRLISLSKPMTIVSLKKGTQKTQEHLT